MFQYSTTSYSNAKDYLEDVVIVNNINIDKITINLNTRYIATKIDGNKTSRIYTIMKNKVIYAVEIDGLNDACSGDLMSSFKF